MTKCGLVWGIGFLAFAGFGATSLGADDAECKARVARFGEVGTALRTIPERRAALVAIRSALFSGYRLEGQPQTASIADWSGSGTRAPHHDLANQIAGIEAVIAADGTEFFAIDLATENQRDALDMVEELFVDASLTESAARLASSTRFRWCRNGMFGFTCAGVVLHLLGFSGGPGAVLFTGPLGLATTGILHYLYRADLRLAGGNALSHALENLGRHRAIVAGPEAGAWAYTSRELDVIRQDESDPASLVVDVVTLTNDSRSPWPSTYVVTRLR